MSSENQASEKQKKTSPKTVKKDLAGKTSDAIKEVVGLQRRVIGRVRKVKTRMKFSVLERSERAEQLHLNTATWPLKRLAKVHHLEQMADDLIAIQAKTIGHGYELMRNMVTRVDDIAEEILNRAETHLAA
jgi:hypothetical protein